MPCHQGHNILLAAVIFTDRNLACRWARQDNTALIADTKKARKTPREYSEGKKE